MLYSDKLLINALSYSATKTSLPVFPGVQLIIFPELVILISVKSDCYVPPRIRYVESSYFLFNT